MDRGRIKLYRCSVDNELYFSENFTKRQAWQDLILNCNHKDKTIFIRGVEKNINRGQIGWSELTMSKRRGWSRDKVRRFLSWLEIRQQIIQQKDNTTTIITIIKYENFQGDDTPNNTPEKHQKNTRKTPNNTQHKNDKNDNNENNDNNEIFINKYLESIDSFKEMRKKIKKPMTDKAVGLLEKKLDRLSKSNEDIKIKILEQSILNCWSDVYELKNPTGLKKPDNLQRIEKLDKQKEMFESYNQDFNKKDIYNLTDI